MTTVTRSPRPHVQTVSQVQPPPRTWINKLLQSIRENYLLVLLSAPGIVLIFLFSYVPMFGTIIAFQDYSPRTMFASPWVGFRNFRLLLETPLVTRLVVNTVVLNLMFISATTFFAVSTALLLNEVRHVGFKRFAQSIMFLPFFMGWTVVAMVLFGLIDYQVGTVNAALSQLGMERVIITDKPELWPWILTLIRIWKGTGAGCIIYLAVLVSVDPQLYEAAAIDGASRWQRMRFISLPALAPVVILLVLLDIGRIFFGDFGMIYAVIGDKAQLYPTTDVIDTYLLRALRTNSNYGFSAAVGLVQAILGFICIYGSNWLVKRYSQRRDEDYSLF
ncbi:MAG: sugar ABC transporter permease [Caldilineaceae bacterium]|nr:sugar ABC transporter permease [Caldilineaceae bacterium]